MISPEKALMKAAIQGHIECIGLLLSNGADDTICDPTNKMCAKGQRSFVFMLSRFENR